MCYAVPTFQLKVWFPLASRKTTGNVVARRRQVFCLVALFFIFKWVVDEGKNSSLGIMSSVFHQGWCEDLIPKSSPVDAIAFSIWLFISFTLKSKKTERKDLDIICPSRLFICQIDCPSSIAQHSERRYTQRKAASSCFIDNLVSWTKVRSFYISFSFFYFLFYLILVYFACSIVIVKVVVVKSWKTLYWIV